MGSPELEPPAVVSPIAILPSLCLHTGQGLALESRTADWIHMAAHHILIIKVPGQLQVYRVPSGAVGRGRGWTGP